MSHRRVRSRCRGFPLIPSLPRKPDHCTGSHRKSRSFFASGPRLAHSIVAIVLSHAHFPVTTWPSWRAHSGAACLARAFVSSLAPGPAKARGGVSLPVLKEPPHPRPLSPVPFRGRWEKDLLSGERKLAVLTRPPPPRPLSHVPGARGVASARRFLRGITPPLASLPLQGSNLWASKKLGQAPVLRPFTTCVK